MDGSEKVTQFSLTLDYIDLYNESIVNGTLQTDGPSVFDMEVLQQCIGSRQTTVEVLEGMLEFSYGHLEHFTEVREKLSIWSRSRPEEQRTTAGQSGGDWCREW
ncbi:hypothetical protein LLH00_00105 [bacterium]|nr:hypothetical protein [bacterium]